MPLTIVCEAGTSRERFGLEITLTGARADWERASHREIGLIVQLDVARERRDAFLAEARRDV